MIPDVYLCAAAPGGGDRCRQNDGVPASGHLFVVARARTGPLHDRTSKATCSEYR
jgi:hypothetical protein